MKFFISGIVFLFLMLFCSVQGIAQVNLLDATDLSNTKIDSYSDAELQAFYDKAMALKLGEAEIYKIIKDKGLSDTEINKLKNRMIFITAAKPAGNNTIAESISDDRRLYDSSAQKLPMQDINKDLSIFGAELFLRNSLVFEPNLRIATPSSYILGPDDEIVINVYGYSEKKYILRVSEEGEIYIPNVGPLFVSGLSIEQATQKIKTKLSATIYRAINSGQTKVQLSLGKIRSIRVTVIGQAEKPGTFTVSSLTTLYNILYLCGGPGNMGSYRSIEIIRGNEVKRVADLYAFLVQGNQKDNILLQEGDVIRIPYYKNRVKISGNVKRQGKFEMLDNETFDQLLQFCGGFEDFAFKAAVSVTRITDTEKKIIDLDAPRFSSFAINAGDEYFIGKLQDKFSNKVSISGSVLRPGNYELSPGLSVKELIAKAGGLSEVAYTERISVFRYNKNRLPSVISFNLDSAININAQVLLQKDDSVSIHSIFDFKDNQVVSIEGNVRRPGTMQWRQNMSLQDLLLEAGGVKETGDSAIVEISRRLQTADVGTNNYAEAETFMISIAKDNNLAKDIILKPFDLVIVKNLPGFIPQRTVMVLGDVKIPGRYGLQNSGDRITDIIQRVGGFKASADSSSITIRRSIKSNLSVTEREAIFQRLLNLNSDSIAANPKLRNEVYKSYDLISVNLNAALTKPSSSENLVLEDGDILTIDKNTNLVKISGEVYYSTIIPYKTNKDAKYYIKLAGSFTPSARKSGTLVIYPDGKAKSVKTFLWAKKYPEVTSRSEIFVPQKNRNNRNKIGAGELALIVSALGIMANVIIAAIK